MNCEFQSTGLEDLSFHDAYKCFTKSAWMFNLRKDHPEPTFRGATFYLENSDSFDRNKQ